MSNMTKEFVINVNIRSNKFSLMRGKNLLSENNIFPEPGESIRLVSPAGGFSSCCVVMALAEQARINKVNISTLRVGKKEMRALRTLNIPDVSICLGGIALENAKKYDYARYMEHAVENWGWKAVYMRNHSKIILLDTDRGKITIETSSNFNENPQIEQFCVTNDDSVYDFYFEEFKRLGAWE